jgi:hypothetical protein
MFHYNYKTGYLSGQWYSYTHYYFSRLQAGSLPAHEKVFYHNFSFFV